MMFCVNDSKPSRSVTHCRKHMHSRVIHTFSCFVQTSTWKTNMSVKHWVSEKIPKHCCLLSNGIRYCVSTNRQNERLSLTSSITCGAFFSVELLFCNQNWMVGLQAKLGFRVRQSNQASQMAGRWTDSTKLVDRQTGCEGAAQPQRSSQLQQPSYLALSKFSHFRNQDG